MFFFDQQQTELIVSLLGILVLKVASKNTDVLRHVTSTIESNSYTDIHWRQVITADLSSAFGKAPGTFVSSATLVVKFRRRRTEFHCTSHEYFVRATMLYALQRETRSLESKSMNLIVAFIQSSLAHARYQQCQSLANRLGETNVVNLQVNAIKIQRFWRSCAFMLSSSDDSFTSLRSPVSKAKSLEQLCASCLLLQATARGFLLRQRFRNLSDKAHIIQRAWASYISRSRLRIQPSGVEAPGAEDALGQYDHILAAQDQAQDVLTETLPLPDPIALSTQNEQAMSDVNVLDEAVASAVSEALNSSIQQHEHQDEIGIPTSLPTEEPLPTETTESPSRPTGRIVPMGQEQTGRWTRLEQERFISGLETYGKDWKKIAIAVETRTIVQVRTHAQKFQKKLSKIFDKKEGEVSLEDAKGVVGGTTESVGGRMRLRVDEGELKRLQKLHALFSTTHGGYGKN